MFVSGSEPDLDEAKCFTGFWDISSGALEATDRDRGGGILLLVFEREDGGRLLAILAVRVEEIVCPNKQRVNMCIT
jgi:hypothetical protein